MGRYLETVHCPLGSNTHQDVHADGHNGFWNMERLGADVHDCNVRNDRHTKQWNRCGVQPCRAWAWCNGDVRVRLYVLSFLQHRAYVCADGDLVGWDLVWRSADV